MSRPPAFVLAAVVLAHLAHLFPGALAYGELLDTICWCRSGEQGPTFGVVCGVAALAGGSCVQYYSIIAGFIGYFPREVVESMENGTFFEARSACPGPELLECQPNARVIGQAEQDVPRLWNLDQLDSNRDGKYHYAALGTGVHVYVLDTGVYPNHSEFAYPSEDIAAGHFSESDRRVILGTSTIRGDPSPVDCFGHGTMVAGVVAGKTFGVAKNATIVSVKTLDCDGVGNVGSVLEALGWVRDNHAKPAVVQMSLATTQADLRLDAAAARLVDEGLTIVASAGNFKTDVDNCSPAREPSVIAVAASNVRNRPWRSSNYGSGITLFAPGANIISSYKYIPALGRSFSKNADGTSMAAPHVSGAIALFLQHNPGSSPQQVLEYLREESVEGVLTDLPEGTPNILLRVDPEANAPLLALDVDRLEDVLLFQGENTTVEVQIINEGMETLEFDVDVEVEGLFGGWLEAEPATGAVLPGGSLTLSLTFNALDLWEGAYNARVAVRSNALNSEEALPVTMLILCEALREQDPASERRVAFPDGALAVHAVLPPWEAALATGALEMEADRAGHVWVQMPVRFSHPVKALDINASVSVSTGEVLKVSHADIRGAMCGDMLVEARVPVTPWQSSVTKVCVRIQNVTDVYGGTYGNSSSCLEARHQLFGRLMGVQMAAHGSLPPLTSRANLTIMAAFSQELDDSTLGEGAFRVVGPAAAAVSGLKRVHMNMPFWALALKLPPDYFGPVAVELAGEGVRGANGEALMPVSPLRFVREGDVLVEANAYRLDGSPSMLDAAASSEELGGI